MTAPTQNLKPKTEAEIKVRSEWLNQWNEVAKLLVPAAIAEPELYSTLMHSML